MMGSGQDSDVASAGFTSPDVSLESNVKTLSDAVTLITSSSSVVEKTKTLSAVCGQACKTDHDCPDSTGVCTYCRQQRCRPVAMHCGIPQPVNDTSAKQYLMIGDSISIGIYKTGGLFGYLKGYESQHIPINGGNAKKG